MSTVIIVPMYNEAKRLDQEAFIKFSAENLDFKFILVDDGSLDTTSALITAMARQSEDRMEALLLVNNSGKAEAVRQGFLKAFELNPKQIGYLDADLATPLEALIELKNQLGNGIEIVLASRVRLLGRRIERNLLRHLLGRCAATLASLTLQLPVYDTQCGAKVFNNTVALKWVFSQPFKTRWIFDIEILARFICWQRMHGGGSLLSVIVEYPLMCWEDKKGSKIKPEDYLKSLVELFSIYRLLRTSKISMVNKTPSESLKSESVI